MAVPIKEASVGGHVGQEVLVGGKMPDTPPSFDDAVGADAPSGQNSSHTASDPGKRVEEVPSRLAEDNSVTPTSEYPPLIQAPTDPQSSTNVQDLPQSLSKLKTGGEASTSADGDYFIQKRTTFSSMSPRLNKRPTSSQPDGSQILIPTEKGGSSWRDISTQTVIGPTHETGSARQTSLPDYHTTPLSQSQQVQDYPQYPDQSFAALQSHPYSPPYKHHPIRTRDSLPAQNLNYTPNDQISVKDPQFLPSGAKSVGNTPAQSPGLFSPMFPTKKSGTETEDVHHVTSMLHPSHRQAPKETHKLLKDVDPISGRKLVNNYEFVKKLGNGQHGTVKLSRNLDTDELVAVKIVRRFSKRVRLGKAGDPSDMIKKEVAILKKARHPHVVSLFEVIDDEEFSKVYLILEYVERGEIVWRKPTEKAIAHFEMDRLCREKADGFNETLEREAVERFNSEVPARRLEKFRILEDQKRQARQPLENQPSGSQLSTFNPFWSLEYGNESENDLSIESPQQSTSNRGDTRLSRADLHAAEKADRSIHSATPTHTPISQIPLSQPTSTPDSPSTRLEGTMYGAYLDDRSVSDLTLQSQLNQIITNSTQWSEEEEDYRYVPCLTLPQALDAFRDTVLGLEYLHYQGIIHRDIKPANLLWTTDYRVKISDFGVSYLGKPIREDDNKEEIPEADAAILDEAIELAKTVGTPAFYAPELCDPQYFEDGKRPERPAITGQIDVWALGVTLYGIVFGRLPFYHGNEFKMYERIARDEVFIPRWRLKGVEHTDKQPSNQNKRLDDVLEYEEVDDTLRDLLKRLLAKQPSHRISLKEVKHHPWVVSGIENQASWLDETDPSLQSQGKKIEVSVQEVQDAVVGLNLVDRLKSGVQRLGSVLRGRGSRKRHDSNPKPLDPSTLASATKMKEERRSSLRGDENIFSALRASRDGAEHPLAQSVAASPEPKNNRSYFAEDEKPMTPDDTPSNRPTLNDRTLSTANSTKTIRPPALPAISMDISSSPRVPAVSGPIEDFSTATSIVDTNSSSSSNLGGLFGGAGRRFVNSMRSRERGVGRSSTSQSSRSSSVDTEELHASPSLAVSSTIAAGHVDQPPALREDAGPRHLPTESSTEAFQRAQEENYRRRMHEYAQLTGHRKSVSGAEDVACPPSPDDEIFFAQQRPTSAGDSTSAFAISSSSDQIVSGESTTHSRIPSVVSGASSLSATMEEEELSPHIIPLEKTISPLTIINRRSGSRPRSQQAEESSGPMPALTKATADDEAGYNGEGEQDSDSEDEGLAMA